MLTTYSSYPAGLKQTKLNTMWYVTISVITASTRHRQAVKVVDESHIEIDNTPQGMINLWLFTDNIIRDIYIGYVVLYTQLGKVYPCKHITYYFNLS